MRDIIPLFTILFSSTLIAQHIGYKSFEKNFIDQNNNRNLSEEKGWKWYKRWENFQVQRLKANGELVSDNELYSTLKEHSKTNQAHSRSSSVSWYPGGPSHDYGTNPSSEMNVQVGRVNTIAFHPTDAKTFYVGVAQGGVWKTTDDGENWTPLMDHLPTLRVSDISIDPQHPDTMYACMGDYGYIGVALHTDDRKRHTHYGIGIYKSVDGGANWSETGLNFEQKNADNTLMRRLFVHPEKSDSLVAAGVSGVWVSSDGGDNWTNVLEESISDFEQDPNHPNVLYATGWYDQYSQSGTSAVYKSTDFGRTWTNLQASFIDQGNMERIELAIARSNSNYIYAIVGDIESEIHGIYRSTDGGANWTTQLKHYNYGGDDNFSYIGAQAVYDLAILVDPNNENTIYFGGLVIARSDDGGRSYEFASDYGGTLHPDQHYFDYNPLDQQIYICNDGGVVRTDDLHTNYCDWQSLSNNIQTTSFYRLSVSKNNPEYVIAGAQDNNTHYGDTTNKEWDIISGGDGMECIINPDNDVIYASWQYGALRRSSNGGANWSNISPSSNGAWTTPYLMAPNNENTLYAAYGDVYKSTNKGSNWTKLSDFPNMSNYSRPSPASALAISDDENYIYVAKRIYHSYNEQTSLHVKIGENDWSDITHDNMKDLYITYLNTDSSGEIIWASLGGFEDGEKVYRSNDGGTTWYNESFNLPNLPVNCIIADKKSTNNLVYVGTDRGVYYKNDKLDEWQIYGANLPNVIVSELELNYQSNQIYAATFGRGVWIAPAIDREVAVENFITEIEKIDISVQRNASLSYQFERKEAKKAGRIDVINIMGAKIISQAIETNQKSLKINLPNEGVFFVRYTINDQSKVLKFTAF